MGDQSPYQKKGYLGGRNNQTQRNGFGTFVQKFQTVSGKSKYGVPIFLANGNVNPAYLAAEGRNPSQVEAEHGQGGEEAQGLYQAGQVPVGRLHQEGYWRRRLQRGVLPVGPLSIWEHFCLSERCIAPFEVA